MVKTLSNIDDNEYNIALKAADKLTQPLNKLTNLVYDASFYNADARMVSGVTKEAQDAIIEYANELMRLLPF